MAPMIEDQDLDMLGAQSNLPIRSSKRKQMSLASLSGTRLPAPDPESELELVCVGFGPASLAIAIAIQDKVNSHVAPWLAPKVLFLERQSDFAWHSGMLLPDAKMQISFIKDLATLRDPCSKFTFLNYLKEHQRLVQFSNLGTFLPSRLEFADYMRWCASHFTNIVEYGQEVVKIIPSKNIKREKSDHLVIEIRDQSGQTTTRKTRNVVIAVGGLPKIPSVFSGSDARVIHSSQYCHKIPDLLPIREKQYHIAVVGSGQSAAEAFNDLHTRYPNAHTRLIMRDTALRPSDDSPFVNEIFDPEAVTSFYNQPHTNKASSNNSNKSTNYSVVRSELIDRVYETLYHQSITEPEKSNHQHQILPRREIIEAVDLKASRRVNLELKITDPASSKSKEILGFDAVILATGYARDAHVGMLKECQVLNGSKDGSWEVGRDYKVKLNREFAGKRVGIWLQGCNESTHGLSDSLLSILATRSGELVESIFGAGEKID